MQKLGALDANFLYSESDLMPNHIASVQRLELPAGVIASEFIESLKSFIQKRLHLVPYLHRRLKFVPGNLDHPFWVHDRDFDIDNHIVEVPVVAPGGAAEFEATIAELHSKRMDRSRPLWAMYVLTGLEDGTIAYYNQVHHCAVDGMGGQAALCQLMDPTPEHPDVEAPEGFPQIARDDAAELLRLSALNLVKFQLGSASRMLGGMESARRMFQRAIDPSRSLGAIAERAPGTRFNRSISGKRTWSAGELPMAEIKSIGRQLGCTMNDVFMTICAGALRRYLQRLGELPATGLIAGCPVSLRRPGSDAMNNQVTMMNVNLATHIEDPRARLLSIHQSAMVAKEVTADLAHGYESNVALPGLPAMMSMAAQSAEAGRMADVSAMPINLVISNVPGPQEELYSNGARALTHYPVSIPAHGIGVNITLQSYAGGLYFGITGCANLLPDAAQLRDDMIDAYVELKQLLVTNVAPIRRQPEAGQEAPGEAAGQALTRVA